MPVLTSQFQQSYDPEIHSPNEMVVDSSDDYVVPGENDKEPVAIINPESLDADGDQPENVTLATDCMLLPSIALGIHGKSSG